MPEPLGPRRRVNGARGSCEPTADRSGFADSASFGVCHAAPTVHRADLCRSRQHAGRHGAVRWAVATACSSDGNAGDNDGKHRISGHFGAGGDEGHGCRELSQRPGRTGRGVQNRHFSRQLWRFCLPPSERCVVGSRYFFAERSAVGSQVGCQPAFPARQVGNLPYALPHLYTLMD